MSQRLSLVTLNVWALPFGIARRTSERLREIGERMRRWDADVLLLQEAWTDAAREGLAAAARASGRTHVFDPGGGLLVASHLPFEAAEFRPYALAGIATHLHRGDYQGGKGFARVRVRTAVGPLELVNTHLHAQYEPDGADAYLGHRTGQAVELAAALGEPALPLVAAGDFNTSEGRPEYRVLTGLAGLRDAGVELDRREPTSGSGERIDLVFARDAAGTAARPVALERISVQGELSDHAGLAAEIELADTPGASVARDAAAHAQAAEILARSARRARARRRQERVTAGAALLAAASALLAARQTRRRFLGRGLAAGAALAAPVGLVQALSSERWVPGEVEAFARVEALLASL
jgi:sphingomyelin phosphodiesterase 2